MTLTAGEVEKLKSTHQEMRCRFVSLPKYEIESIISVSTGPYSWTDLINIFPRYSWVANSASILLDGSQSLAHGGTAATGHTWTLTDESGGAAAGSLSGSGSSVTYTGPVSGNGVDRINLTTTNSDSIGYGYIAYGDTNLNIGTVTGFHADENRGGWEMTVRAYGDCTGLERQKAVVLAVDMYWNGSEDTFGGTGWSNGVFTGYIHARRTIHEDSEQAYLELTIVSPQSLLAKASLLIEAFFSSGSETDAVQITDLKVIDVIWYLVVQSNFNWRNNTIIFDDTNAIANLKISPGTLWDIMVDVAGRAFCRVHCKRQGSLYAIPDPDIRSDEYSVVSEELTMTTALFESIDIVSQDISVIDPDVSPPDPADQEIAQVVLNALNADLDEIWARWPSNQNIMGGRRVEISGLICESPGTLETWAGRYWYKLNPQLEADLRLFAMPIWDIYSWLLLTYTPDANRVSNTGIETSPNQEFYYVTSIDYEIDPGMGTWRGGIHIINQADQSPPNIGENSSD